LTHGHFAPVTLIQLEKFGLCGWGEANDFIADSEPQLRGMSVVRARPAGVTGAPVAAVAAQGSSPKKH
jgi:hypothetical protein